MAKRRVADQPRRGERVTAVQNVRDIVPYDPLVLFTGHVCDPKCAADPVDEDSMKLRDTPEFRSQRAHGPISNARSQTCIRRLEPSHRSSAATIPLQAAYPPIRLANPGGVVSMPTNCGTRVTRSALGGQRPPVAV